MGSTFKKSRRLLLVALLVTGAAASVQAQEEEKVSLWSGEVSAGAGVSQGNTEKANVNLGLVSERNTDENNLKFKFSADWASTDWSTDKQQLYGMGRYSYNFGEDNLWYNFYVLELDSDRFANIKWRATPTTGIGYWWSNTEDYKLRTEAGLGWERTEFRDGTSSRSDAVLVGTLNFDKKVSQTARLTQDLSIWPSLGQFGEFRLRSETALTTTVTEAVSMRLSLIDDYLSDPAGDKKANDIQLIASAVYTY